MCGRYYISTEDENIEIKQLLEEVSNKFKDDEKLSLMKTGEICPTNFAPVIINNNFKEDVEIFRWGIKLENFKSNLIINARIETIREKPLFRRLLNNRCIIVANYFFEWDKKENRKVKNIISLEGRKAIYMAGLYGAFKENNNIINCFVIITTEANSQMRKIHDRMPVILKDEIRQSYLFEKSNDLFKELIMPYDEKLVIEQIK